MRNFALLVTVFVLGIFAYLQQEKKIFSKSHDELNLSFNVERLSYRYGDIIRGRAGFQFKEFPYPLMNAKIEALIKDFNQIRLNKKIEVRSEEKKSFFPDENNFFKIDEMELHLGDKVPGSAQFYLSVTKNGQTQYFIASYELPKTDQTYYLSEEEKFSYVWGIFNFPRQEWYDKEFIKNIVGTIFRVELNNRTKKSFTINFREGKINPSAYSGIELNLEKIKELRDSFNVMSFKEIQIKDGSLKNIISEILFETNGMQKKLQLYQEFKGTQGLFASFENDQYVFILDEKNAKPFFLNLTDFWLKSPVSREAKKSSHFEFSVSDDNKNFKSFKIDEKISPSESLSELIRIFLGIAPYEEADRISDLANEDIILKRDKGLYCKVFDKIYYLTVRKDEILLASLQDKYVLHYYIIGERRVIKTQLSDY